jgi:transposase
MARRLSSYAGLVPSTYASGRAVRHAAIAKRGFSFLRWALVETVMHALRRPGPLQEFYRRLLVGKGAQKARVAGKLSKAIFGMLRTDRSCGGVNSHPGARGQTGWRLPMIWTEAGVLVRQPA